MRINTVISNVLCKLIISYYLSGGVVNPNYVCPFQT